MVRGPKKHLKRVNAPSSWMLSKMGGCFAPKPSPGPHKGRESMPMALLLRNRLKYALTYKEVMSILMQRHVQVDGKVRTDKTFPVGFMDVLGIPKTDEFFRMLYDTKGRFKLHRITKEEASYKLCKVKRCQLGDKAVPYVGLHDSRTIRYPDPDVKVNDSVKVDIESGKITAIFKFDIGQLATIVGGRNAGRAGTIARLEKHKGSHDIAHLRDSAGNTFATRAENVFIIGNGKEAAISMPKGKGVKPSIVQEQAKRFGN